MTKSACRNIEKPLRGGLRRSSAWLSAGGVLLSCLACGDDPKHQAQLPNGTTEYFAGRVYDGVSLNRLTDYSIRLEYYDRIVDGTVDAKTGRYLVGPLLASADYSIVVESAGYRSFLSHNERLAGAASTSLVSLYYDAFLYPESVSVPAVKCRVRLSDSADLPSGFMRFAPRTSSSLFDEDTELPVGVISAGAGRQLWTNDEDMQQRSFMVEFKNGEVEIESGRLVYGVNYEVTIYGVAGHELITGSFTAGVDGESSWVLDPLVQTELVVTSVSTDARTPTANGELEVRFNQPIALDPGVSVTTLQRTLNDAFSFDSPDADADNNRNVMANASATGPVAPGYRGVSLAIEGDLLRLSWSRAGAMSSNDAGDPVYSVTYGGLGSVLVYSANAQRPVPIALSTLLGSEATSVSVQLIAQ
ncbi:MAG: hypothetical protein ABI895_23625 [Deltaproteobacteria bacterium]